MKLPWKRCVRAKRTPTRHRSFAGASVLIALLIAPSVTFGEVLREADVIRLARKNNPEAAVLAHTVEIAKAQNQTASLRSAPSLSLQRQTQGAVESESNLVLSVPINRSQSQVVAAKLARAQVALAQSSELLGSASATRVALESFYLCLAQGESARIAEEVARNLEEAARIVRRRRDEGRVSGYEVARIELALEKARSQALEARARELSTRAVLAKRLGTGASEVTLDGRLLPSSPQNDERGEATSPALVALRSAAGLAAKAQDEAEGLWLPTVALTSGLRTVTTDETDIGYVAGISLTLPIWTGTGALRSATRAKRKRLASQANALEAQRAIRIAGVSESYRLLAEEARRYAAATREPVQTLAKAAASGYREGERTLLELIDASQAESEVRKRIVELELAARLAELAFRDARGGFEQ